MAYYGVPVLLDDHRLVLLVEAEDPDGARGAAAKLLDAMENDGTLAVFVTTFEPAVEYVPAPATDLNQAHSILYASMAIDEFVLRDQLLASDFGRWLAEHHPDVRLTLGQLLVARAWERGENLALLEDKASEGHPVAMLYHAYQST